MSGHGQEINQISENISFQGKLFIVDIMFWGYTGV